nr:hypothetical protein [uncultured Desulfobacter sp.]
MLFIAIANGALRQFTFGKVMPELRAHQLSTIIGSILIGSFIWFVISFFPPASGKHAVMIGVIWLCLTVVFESFMGLVLAREPLSKVLHDYNLFEGRVWALFLIWITVAPWLFLIIQNPA